MQSQFFQDVAEGFCIVILRVFALCVVVLVCVVMGTFTFMYVYLLFSLE